LTSVAFPARGSHRRSSRNGGALLNDAPLAEGAHPFWRFTFWHERERLWLEHRETILAGWIRDHPGTRPRTWWSLDAPEPRRQRLARGGTPVSRSPWLR